MKILEVTHRFPPALGGVEAHVAALSTRLVASGHEVEVVTTDVRRDTPFVRLGPVPRPPSFPVRRHRAIRLLPLPQGTGTVAPGMGLDLATSRADVVHAHAFGYAPTWLAALTRRARPGRLVIGTHADEGGGSPVSELYHRWAARATLRRADRVVALTEHEAGLLVRWGVDPSRVEVIPHGIDLQEFPTVPRVERTGPPVVLFVGRLVPEQKGLEPLVRAFAQLPSPIHPTLRLVGEDWAGAERVRELARHLGVSDRVILLGALSRAEVIAEMASADVFVLPSLFEPFGIVLLEAMASGLPVVATRVGGVPEVVEEGKTALLVPPNDPTRLAEALGQLLLSAELQREYGRAGRARAARFRWESILPRWLNLFGQFA